MPFSRRRFLATAGSTLAVPAVHAAQDTPKPLFSFGLMADCQYADVDPAGSRFYRGSLNKLQEAVAELNKHPLALTFHLGDFIDRDFQSFDDLDPVAKTLRSPLHHALGNHDFDVADDFKARIPGRLNLERGYYRLRRAGVRFLVIDTTEFSVYRHPADDPRTASARSELQHLAEQKSRSAQPWNSRPGDAQLAWLEEELRAATDAGEAVLVLGHHPILPDASHSVWNAGALSALLHRHACCKAYLNGHNHAGAYAQAEGVHYLTLDGMVETKDQNAFALAHLFPDRLEIRGFGRQESHRLTFR